MISSKLPGHILLIYIFMDNNYGHRLTFAFLQKNIVLQMKKKRRDSYQGISVKEKSYQAK